MKILKKLFLNLFSNRRSKSKPESLVVSFVLDDVHMTFSQFANQLANCFVGVKRPEKTPIIQEVIFSEPQDDISRLVWKDNDHTIVFVYIDSKDDEEYAIAEIKIPEETYKLLKGMYQKIGTDVFCQQRDIHILDLTPIKTTFSVST